MRIAVTGAAGFIGSHLSEKLVGDGHEVIGIDSFDDFYEPARKHRNLTSVIENPRFQLVETDIGEPETVKGALIDVDAVVHLAARAGVRPSFDNAGVYVGTNVIATARLLELVSDLGIPRLVFISSSSVYGDGAKSPFREDGELGIPKSPYAATKVAGEALCHALRHRIPHCTVLRLFSVYGPRQRPDLAIQSFAERILAGEAIPVLGSLDSFRDYTYVEDVVAGIQASIELEEPWAVLNIGCGHPVTLGEMIEHLEHALGRQVERQMLPPHPGDLFGTRADIDVARRLIGFRPRWTFEKGVTRFAEWFLEEADRAPR